MCVQELCNSVTKYVPNVSVQNASSRKGTVWNTLDVKNTTFGTQIRTFELVKRIALLRVAMAAPSAPTEAQVNRGYGRDGNIRPEHVYPFKYAFSEMPNQALPSQTNVLWLFPGGYEDTLTNDQIMSWEGSRLLAEKCVSAGGDAAAFTSVYERFAKEVSERSGNESMNPINWFANNKFHPPYMDEILKKYKPEFANVGVDVWFCADMFMDKANWWRDNKMTTARWFVFVRRGDLQADWKPDFICENPEMPPFGGNNFDWP